jgi:hypothetical protein
VARVGLASVAVSIILVPVLTIYLGNLSQELRAAIVAVFLAVCIAVIVTIVELTEQEMCLYLAAYVSHSCIDISR